jgi:hypothetical protein
MISCTVYVYKKKSAKPSAFSPPHLALLFLHPFVN